MVCVCKTPNWVKDDSPQAIRAIGTFAKENFSECFHQDKDILNSEGILGISNCLELEGVFNTNKHRHTERVLDISRLPEGGYLFSRYDPNWGIEISQCGKIKEDALNITQGIRFEFISYKRKNQKKVIADSNRGLTNYLGDYYFRANSIEPHVLNKLDEINELNNANDCGPICIYVLWLKTKLELGESYSVSCLYRQLKL